MGSKSSGHSGFRRDSCFNFSLPAGHLPGERRGEHGQAMSRFETVRSRRLIVNADDFGRSASINQAVAQAHLKGILTTASLMVNETAAGEAIALARDLPRLGIGLH